MRKDGYVRVTVPGLVGYDSSRKLEQKLEHRHVVEQHLGRKLESDEIVHHLNGIRDDNRIENLEVIKKSPDGKTNHETWTFLKAQRQRVKVLEKKIEELNSKKYIESYS